MINMITEKLLKHLNTFRELNFNDELNLINIFQDLSTNFPKCLPLDSDEIKAEIKQQLSNLGLNPTNLLLSDTTYLRTSLSSDDYKWNKYHSGFRINDNAFWFTNVIFNKQMLKLIVLNDYQKDSFAKVEKIAKGHSNKADLARKNLALLNNDTNNDSKNYHFLIPLTDVNADRLLNLLILYCLSLKQQKVLDQNILSYAAKLIYVQQSSISDKINVENAKKIKADFGHETNDFLHEFKIPRIQSSDYEQDVTVNGLIKYMYDLLHDLPVDPAIFNLITNGNSDTNTINIIVNQARQLSLKNVLSSVSSTEMTKIKQKLSNTVAKKVSHVWKINHQADNHQYNDNAKHMMVIHGTQNLSVLNILGEGLKDSTSLRKQGSKHYVYTGSGLGNGIYFARLDQADKSYNYTESECNRVHSYMFIADVAYNKVYKTKSYGNLNTDCDLVWGQAVGSYDRDEIVAKHPEQVQIKYLLQLN